MADELDSGSSVGYYVWVQVPSSALYIREAQGYTEVFSYIQTEACLVPKVQDLRSVPHLPLEKKRSALRFSKIRKCGLTFYTHMLLY